MSSKAHAERLARALESTGLAQAVTNTLAENRINVICRVPSSNESKWTELIRNLLIATEEESDQLHAWLSHICRTYFLKELDSGEKKLVWGWNISIQSTTMTASLDAISKVIRGEAIRKGSRRKEETEFPLVGASDSRNSVRPGGKGARPSTGDFHPLKSGNS